MRLTVEQSRKALAEHGCYVTEACDACRKLLGAVRYTRRGELGEWCSELCRDGAEQVAARAERRGGRPRKHGTNAERQRAYRSSRLGPLRNPIAGD
jgi:hypothetical protein